MAAGIVWLTHILKVLYIPWVMSCLREKKNYRLSATLQVLLGSQSIWFPLHSLVRSGRSNTKACKMQGVILLIISPLICFAAGSSPQWWMDAICPDPGGDPRQSGWQWGGRRCWVSCVDVRWACPLWPAHASRLELRVCSQGLRAVFGVLSNISISVAF